MTKRCAIEIHDSVLAGISFSQDEAQLHFSPAYIHQSEGIPGRDTGTGWVQEAVLRIRDARIEGSFSEFPVDLSDGQIHLGQNISENLIPIPLHCSDGVEIRLEAWQAEKEVIIVKGSGAELELVGEPKYVEEFRP